MTVSVSRLQSGGILHSVEKQKQLFHVKRLCLYTKLLTVT